MPPPKKAATPTTTPENLPAMMVAGWLIPGAAHVMAGQVSKGAVLFVTLGVMFVYGVASGGRLFPFVPSDPLLFLAAVSEWALGLPHLVATLAGFGRGEVVVASYEYGNTFLIVAGLLNMLVLLDAFDLATGRKAAS